MMNDMMGLGLMGLLGNGGGLGGFGMDQMGMGGAMQGQMPQIGMGGLFGGMGGMPMGGMMGAQSILGMFLQRKQQEEELKQRREMFNQYIEMMKQRQMRRAPMQRPQGTERQFPLYTF